MLPAIVLILGGCGAFFDARALRPQTIDEATTEERHRLRIIALKFYRTGFAMYIGLTAAQLILR